MTHEEATALAEQALRRGMCSTHKLARESCTVCETSEEAIRTLRTLPVITRCEDACRHAAKGSREGTTCRHPKIIGTRIGVRERLVEAPASWCPLRAGSEPMPKSPGISSHAWCSGFPEPDGSCRTCGAGPTRKP